MLLTGPKVLLYLTVLIIPSEWTPLGVSGQRGDDVTPVTPETFTEDPNLVNEPSTDETVLADIEPSSDDLASPNDKIPQQIAGMKNLLARDSTLCTGQSSNAFISYVSQVYDVCISSTMRSAPVLSVKNTKL